MTTAILQKSKYKGVSHIILNGKYKMWTAYICRKAHIWKSYFQTERQAALAYDRKLLEYGEEPVNILKKILKLSG